MEWNKGVIMASADKVFITVTKVFSMIVKSKLMKWKKNFIITKYMYDDSKTV